MASPSFLCALVAIICHIVGFVNIFCNVVAFLIDFAFSVLYTRVKGGGNLMNERIKKLRKALDLTQQEFADKLNIKRGAVANYEIGRNEPIDAVISLICREFNVNEDWLRNGTGEMFLEIKESSIIAKATELLGEKDPLFEAFVDTYSKLTPKNRELLFQFMTDLSRSFTEKKKE